MRASQRSYLSVHTHFTSSSASGRLVSAVWIFAPRGSLTTRNVLQFGWAGCIKNPLVCPCQPWKCVLSPNPHPFTFSLYPWFNLPRACVSEVLPWCLVCPPNVHLSLPFPHELMGASASRGAAFWLVLEDGGVPEACCLRLHITETHTVCLVEVLLPCRQVCLNRRICASIHSVFI